jgi:hypothetical protein
MVAQRLNTQKSSHVANDVFHFGVSTTEMCPRIPFILNIQEKNISMFSCVDNFMYHQQQSYLLQAFGGGKSQEHGCRKEAIFTTAIDSWNSTIGEKGLPVK